MSTFQPPPQMYSPPPQRTGADGLAIASMVLGILSCPGCLLPFFSGTILGLIGLILGLTSKTKGGIRTTGIICSSIGLALPFILLILGLLGLAALGAAGAAGAKGGP